MFSNSNWLLCYSFRFALTENFKNFLQFCFMFESSSIFHPCLHQSHNVLGIFFVHSDPNLIQFARCQLRIHTPPSKNKHYNNYAGDSFFFLCAGVSGARYKIAEIRWPLALYCTFVVVIGQVINSSGEDKTSQQAFIMYANTQLFNGFAFFKVAAKKGNAICFK